MSHPTEAAPAAMIFRRRTTSGNWIAELDGLRFIAIVSVILFHMQGQLDHHYSLTVGPELAWFAKLVGNGNRGVQLFFAISGFILARPFAEHHLFGKAAPSIRKYFTRRLTRLEPPYIFNLVIVAMGAVFLNRENWRGVLPHLLASMAYVHSLVYRGPSTINSVAWSLEVEVQFYILAPALCLVFALRQPIARRAAMLFSIVALATLQVAFHTSSLNILGEGQYFIAGLLFADLYLTVLPSWRRTWKWDVVSLVGWPVAFAAGGPLGFWLPLLVVILYVAAFRGVVVPAILRNAWIAVMGGMCYTIYLWHAPVMTVTQRMMQRVPVLNPQHYGALFVLHGIIQLIAVAIVCVPCFLLIEKPCMDPRWPQNVWEWIGTRLTRVPAREMAATVPEES